MIRFSRLEGGITIKQNIEVGPTATLTQPLDMRAGATGTTETEKPSPVIDDKTAQALNRIQRTEERVALAMVIIPFVGFIAAIVLLWGRGITLLELVLMTVMYCISCAGIGVGFHRHFTHRAFETNKVMRALLAISGSMAGQGPLLFWAAIHRRHHAYSDKEGDPHSPHLHGEEGVKGLIKGLWQAHTGWLLVPQKRNWIRYVPDLLRDPVIRKVNRSYFLWMAVGLVAPAAIGGLWTMSLRGAFFGFLWGGLVRIFLLHHVTWSINSICHVYGKRPFQSKDLSTNNVWLSVISFGEAWHHNHHTFPRSAKFGLEWWQIDINAIIIRAMEKVGLAKNVNVPSAKAILDAKKKNVPTTEGAA